MSGRVGYLGPRGTNCEEALNSQPDLGGVQQVPCPTVEAVFRAVAAGEVDAGMVPVENSIEGAVNVTLDLLAGGAGPNIRREVVIPVDLNLVGPAGTDLAAVAAVVSHPTANAQCRESLARLVPHARVVAANSTAEAVQAVAGGDGSRVAVGSRFAAQLYGASVLAPDIPDRAGAETRFLLLGGGVPARTGSDKTSIVCHQHDDRPGALLAILQEFAVRGLNLTKIESRPTKQGLGEYYFFIDIEGHISDALVEDALRGLRYRFGDVRYLGSYPRARRGGKFEEDKEEAAWAEAGSWVAGLVAQVEGAAGRGRAG